MKRYDASQIDELADILRKGGAVSVPTDTVYGICARMDSEEAQEHLRDIKHRPQTKAFPLMCADAEGIRSVAETDERSEILIRTFMPGPVTLILKKREEIPAFVNGGGDTLAIRMAPDEVIAELIRKTGCPLYMTSANQSGEKTCETTDEIEAACPGLDGILEGETKFGEASTIIDCTREELKILRQGPVTMEDIEKALEEETYLCTTSSLKH